MIDLFIKLQTDTLAQAATSALVDNVPTANTEISVLEFIVKGGEMLFFEKHQQSYHGQSHAADCGVGRCPRLPR